VALPKIPVGVIIICILFALIGALWGAHAAGLINLIPVLSDLPVVGTYFTTGANEDNFKISPLEEENKKLKEQIIKLEKQLADVLTKENELNQEIETYRKQIIDLDNQIKILHEEQKKMLKLAEYYGQMKTKEVVPIFDNLDDEIVISILSRLDSKRAAEILAEMDPLRAAKLTKVITDINNSVNN
jgi:flagellar motility protein MotE (MotC chaperone)